ILIVSFIFGKEEKKEKVKYPIRHYIIVTANRLEEPADKVSTSFTLITEQEIKQRQVITLAEILTDVPGFIKAQAGSIGHLTSLFIRGSESDHNLVLINGIPINDPLSSYFDFSSLMIDDIERIEIVRGPQSTLYGSDAIGGVINLITKRGKRDTKFNLNFIGGSDSTYKGSFSFSLGNQIGSLYLNTCYFSTRGNFQNDDYKNMTASLRGELILTNKSKLEAFLRYTKTNLGIPFSSASILSPNRRQRTEETILSLPFTGNFSFMKLKLNLSYFRRNYIFNDPDSFWSYSHTRSRALRFDIQSDINYSKGIFTIGGEWRNFVVFSEDNFGTGINNKRFDIRAFFVQNQTHLHNLSITAGIRIDHHTEFGFHVSPRITGALFLNDTKLKASAGTGFRAPRPFELYTFWGNRNLKPEISKSLEVGIEQKLLNSRIIIGITYFSSLIKDLIVYDFSTLKFQNLAQTKINGEELSFFLIPHRNFNLKLNYTHLIAKDDKNKQLLRRPKHSFNFSFNLRPIEKFNIFLNFIYIGKRKDWDDIHFVTIENSPFNKFDISLKYEIRKNIHIFSKITNVLNERYEEVYGYPSPDRGIYFGVEYGF
ncbi:TonB-dependent receptor, partial [SCandidatus Aminicenantes bacterium Aminicenantia_JdfR_composite]|nr:TonB-dependent receptor [SCandidatus Aminicenantes bacterium Aminicenantia_JdfR_composite]